jgi:predicted O-methyltransferase YrrM
MLVALGGVGRRSARHPHDGVHVARWDRLVRLLAGPVGYENVEVVSGDAVGLMERGPFDLLVLDGGPGSEKKAGAPVEPATLLRPGGALTVDDYTPTTTWPPMHEGGVDESRVHWLLHPDLQATEIRVATDLSVVVARYFPDA